jgi:hypothetical protein
MKKDILQPTVEDIAVAVVLEEIEGENQWIVYLINLKKELIRNVIIVSKGYGELNGESKATSTLRFFFEEIPARDFTRVETIMDYTFGLTNEYWVSFYIGETIYDKQFIFLPETISDTNFTQIPLLNVKGVMIR